MTKITAIIPTLNEEDNIQRAINSVLFADEIIVIDSFSTDKTVEIVNQNKNVVLLQRTFDDFSSQKNFAINNATYEWIFLLDADEELPINLQKEIQSKIENLNGFSAFYVYRNFFFKQKKLRFSGWQRDKVIRLFKKGFNSYKGKVHEKIITDGGIGFLEEKLNHYSYKNYTQYQSKLNHYAQLQAVELIGKNKVVTPYHLVLKPIVRFFIQYIIKLGFLDGTQGFIISYVHAYGVFMRYVELLKLKYSKTSKLQEKQGLKEKLKIGFDAKRAFHNTTGLGNYSRDLITILEKYYPSNEYLLYNPKPKKVNRLEIKNNIVEVLPSKKIWKRFSSLWRQFPIVNQIVKDKIDIYHGLSGEIPIGLSNKNVKIVVTIHDLIFIRYPKLYSFFDRKIHYFKFKYAAKKADVIVAISEQTKSDIVDFLNVNPNKIEVIYQGCHSEFKKIKTEEEKAKVREKFNLPDSFILNVGTIEERKNAFSIVKSIEKDNTNLVLIGRKTKYFERINTYINQNNLEHKIFILEGVSLKELSTIYQMAKVFVYPSIFEGFGIPIIEALYSKTPVITSKEGVFPEAAGENSIFVNPNNLEELSLAIKDLLSDDKKRERIAEKGVTFVQKFNDKNIAKNIMKLYKNMI